MICHKIRRVTDARKIKVEHILKILVNTIHRPLIEQTDISDLELNIALESEKINN